LSFVFRYHVEIFGTKVLIPRGFELGGNVHSNALADYCLLTANVYKQYATSNKNTRCNISKTSASFLLGIQSTEKRMKRMLLLFRGFFNPLIKYEARVFDMASQTKIFIFIFNIYYKINACVVKGSERDRIFTLRF
jgi:hypothetical protein